jgi:hypothetical protein
MRAIKTVVIAIASIAALLISSAPASADVTYRLTHPGTGDWAQWNATTNSLTVCDQSNGNGTARTILEVIGGVQKQLFDGNGAQAGCGFDGHLNVDDTKSAYLWICASASDSSCYRSSTSFPL